MSEEATLEDLEALIRGAAEKGEGFDDLEFIVELVDDDEEEGQAQEGDEEHEGTSNDEASDIPQREFFKYADGFLSRSVSKKEEEERRKREELIERKGLFKCSICMKFFLYRSKIHHHLIHDHGVDKGARLNSWVIDEAETKAKPMIPCQICGKTYQMKDSLARHIKVKHTDFEKIKCPLCPTEFTQKSDVERHIRRKHREHIDRGSDDEEEQGQQYPKALPVAYPSTALPPLPGITVPNTFGRRSRMFEDALASQGVNPDSFLPTSSNSSSSKVNDLSSDFGTVVKSENVNFGEELPTDASAASVPAEPFVKDEPREAEGEDCFEKEQTRIDQYLRNCMELGGPSSSSQEIPEYVSEAASAGDESPETKRPRTDESSSEVVPNKIRRKRALKAIDKPTEKPTTKAKKMEQTFKQNAERETAAEVMEKPDTHSNAEIIKCSICTNLFDNRMMFIHHLIKKHGIDKIQAATQTEDWMDRHVAHQCKTCSFKCKNKEELKRHIAVSKG